jgi:isopentenyldiphosphate isomerase
MKTEILDVFDDEMKYLRTASRLEVHKMGLWHQTFHCWFFYEESTEQYLIFQKRHPNKDTFPNLLDITAAGHLASNETTEDGIRELKEELGLDIKYEKLISIGILKQILKGQTFIDKEFCHVHLYHCKTAIELFEVQLEEVSGILIIKIEDFVKLIKELQPIIEAKGWLLDDLRNKKKVTTEVTLVDFVPHGIDYYMSVLSSIYKAIGKRF